MYRLQTLAGAHRIEAGRRQAGQAVGTDIDCHAAAAVGLGRRERGLQNPESEHRRAVVWARPVGFQPVRTGREIAGAAEIVIYLFDLVG